eukprot:GHVU01207024.1.p1 GENE.GHVU01207024.1~~GHVU01207024.1.p1  ORF type:complete len:395 (-),score=30.69 GHVU01207024.1:132-1274(-)
MEEPAHDWMIIYVGDIPKCDLKRQCAWVCALWDFSSAWIMMPFSSRNDFSKIRLKAREGEARFLAIVEYVVSAARDLVIKGTVPARFVSVNQAQIQKIQYIGAAPSGSRLVNCQLQTYPDSTPPQSWRIMVWNVGGVAGIKVFGSLTKEQGVGVALLQEHTTQALDTMPLARHGDGWRPDVAVVGLNTKVNVVPDSTLLEIEKELMADHNIRHADESQLLKMDAIRFVTRRRGIFALVTSKDESSKILVGSYHGPHNELKKDVKLRYAWFFFVCSVKLQRKFKVEVVLGMDANFDINVHVFAKAFGFTTHIGQKRRGRSDDALADNMGKNSVDFLFVSEHARTINDGLPMSGEGGGDHASILRTIGWEEEEGWGGHTHSC